MAPPDWAVRLVQAGRGVLFLDELSTAPPAVQAALLRLVLERRIGALQLPPGVRIVAAANPPSSAADGWELSPPLANRFVHLHWTYDHEVVVRGLGGTWPRATLPHLDPEKFSDAVMFARRAVCELLAARPALVHHLPGGQTRRGGAWPSPRSWDMTVRLIAFATAASSSRDVLSLLVRGSVGDGPGFELLAAVDRMDLVDPETLLADPTAADLPDRGDLRQAVLDAVVAAVRRRPDKSRWDAAWTLLVTAVHTGPPDLVVVPATTLATLRQDDWEVTRGDRSTLRRSVDVPGGGSRGRPRRFSGLRGRGGAGFWGLLARAVDQLECSLAPGTQWQTGAAGAAVHPPSATILTIVTSCAIA